MYSLLSIYPQTNYNNAVASNIMVRAAFYEAVKNKSVLFYPYTVGENERPDTIAANYYGDAKYDWVILLTNNIVDPYFDWPLSNYDFYKYIINKYGSAISAKEQIAFWRVNWYNDDTVLSTSSYDLLTPAFKKYWKLDTESGKQYVRKPIDTAVDTNKIVEIVVDDSTDFTISEKITQYTDGEITASGFIAGINDNTLVCKNIIGTFVTSSDIIGASTSSNATDVTTVSTDIPSAEVGYWEAVSYYDYESELNENKKHINILDKTHLSKLEKEIRDLFV